MKRILTILVCVFMTFQLEAKIQTIRSLTEINKDEISQDTLVVFDLDLTLLTVTDPAFSLENMTNYKNTIKTLLKGLSQEEQDKVWTYMVLNEEIMLLEFCTSDVVKSLQSKGVPVMALTATLGGEKVQKVRSEKLEALGVDLSSSFSEMADYPLFHRGILYTHGGKAPKGEILDDFLKAAKYPYKKIIFVDDRINNVRSVDSLNQQGYDIEAYHLVRHAFDYEEVELDRFVFKWTKLIKEALEANCY